VFTICKNTCVLCDYAHSANPSIFRFNRHAVVIITFVWFKQVFSFPSCAYISKLSEKNGKTFKIRLWEKFWSPFWISNFILLLQNSCCLACEIWKEYNATRQKGFYLQVIGASAAFLPLKLVNKVRKVLDKHFSLLIGILKAYSFRLNFTDLSCLVYTLIWCLSFK